MSFAQLRPTGTARPVVAIVCTVLLPGQAMRSALDVADVRSFSVAGAAIGGWLDWLRPDALIDVLEGLFFARGGVAR